MPVLLADKSLKQHPRLIHPLLSGPWRRLARAMLWLLLFGTWGRLIAAVLIPALQENTWPYSAYWIGPRLALEGRAHLVFADSALYLPEIARLNVSGDMLEVNMPTTLLPFLPFALLSIGDAFRVWTVVSLACFALGWFMLLRAVRLPAGLALLLTAAVPLFEPFGQNIRGQAYLALFSLLTLSALHAVQTPGKPGGARGRQIGGGVLLGAAALLKLYYGLALAVPSIIQRRFTFLASAALVVVVSVLVTTSAWGIGIWERAVVLSLTWRARPETVHTAYQTTHSLLGRLFRYDEQWNPAPVAHLPWLLESLWWLIALSTLGVTALILWKSGRQEALSPLPSPAWQLLAPSAMIPLAIVLAPIGEGYHYALCLFPIVVVITILYNACRHRSPAGSGPGRHLPWDLLAASAALALALVLLGGPWRYNVARVDGWSSLMHYPRLYGALLLWLVIITLLARPPFSRVLADGRAVPTS